MPRKYSTRLRGRTWSAPAHTGTGGSLDMGDPESESEQIRLKCIRKDGFFTVPPEHRVRRGAARGSLPAAGRDWNALEPLSVALKR